MLGFRHFGTPANIRADTRGARFPLRASPHDATRRVFGGMRVSLHIEDLAALRCSRASVTEPKPF